MAIRVDLSKCTGCKRCEAACAFFHTGRINNHLARIKVINIYETGIDGPVVCNQCKERYCLGCPEHALSLGTYGQVIVCPTLCSLCAACEKACPIGAIEIFDGIVFVCDLCGGSPKCVEACTEGAITFDPQENKQPSLAAVKRETEKMNPSQKRYFFLRKLSAGLREKWSKNHA